MDIIITAVKSLERCILDGSFAELSLFVFLLSLTHFYKYSIFILGICHVLRKIVLSGFELYIMKAMGNCLTRVTKYALKSLRGH